MSTDSLPDAKGVTSNHLTPSQVGQAVETLIDLRRPGFIWGPPGIGKSELIEGIAQRRGIELRDVRLGTMDPTEVKGFPVPNIADNVMHWLPPDFLPPMFVEREMLSDVKGKALYQNDSGDGLVYEDGKPYKGKAAPTVKLVQVPNDSEGILFMDELNQAPPMTQAAAYQLLLNRKIGEYELPAGWAMMAAGNRETDRANAQRMPSALALRLVHIDMLPSIDDWSAWAVQHPDQVSVPLLAFLRFKPDLLHKFDPRRRVSPNPRSWIFTDSIAESDLPAEISLALQQGTVGEAEAAEYVAFRGMMSELPTVDQVKLNPDGTAIPNNISAKFGIIAALARANTKDIYPRIKKYIDRFDPEWQVVFHKDALAYDDAFVGTREFQQFSVNHAHLLS